MSELTGAQALILRVLVSERGRTELRPVSGIRRAIHKLASDGLIQIEVFNQDSAMLRITDAGLRAMVTWQGQPPG